MRRANDDWRGGAGGNPVSQAAMGSRIGANPLGVGWGWGFGWPQEGGAPHATDAQHLGVRALDARALRIGGGEVVGLLTGTRGPQRLLVLARVQRDRPAARVRAQRPRRTGTAIRRREGDGEHLARGGP